MDFLDFPDRLWLWLAALSYAIAFALAVGPVLRSRPHPKTALLILLATGFVLRSVPTRTGQRRVPAGQ